ncbi:ArnT family glycosyltransferase [Saccharopolyspora hordei]|uniref:Glycosyltransferase RgtA/B/C/D-like domain-containing protein n=1 Tax=Saccharopolyspora hordei TaxID=1838 RepID=A0A853AUF5_9PSEU|nr:glycosyltransferase family 39 protein [Saccharopolyspora hordei]NYI86284.1 hypothetical protein [Saccharopolyspora hordei]
MGSAVLAAPASPPAELRLRPLATWPVLTIAGLVAVAHLVTSAFGDYWIDEVYMLAAGKYHPDWGYVDQPPVAPLIAAAMDWIAPGSMVVLRLPAVLATAAGVVVFALLAREFGGDRRAQVLAAGAGATGLWIAFVGHWITPYTFEPLQWLVLSWLLVRWIRTHRAGNGDDRLLLVFGVVLGIAAQTKVQVALLCVALLIGVLLVGPRDVLRRPMFWGGVGTALVIAAPTVLWQASHGWPQLQMAEVVARESPMLSGGRSGTAVTLVLYAGVVGTALFLLGLWALFRSAELRPYRFFGVATVLLYVFFVATAGRPYYLVGLYGVVVAAGVLHLQRRREATPPRWGWAAWLPYLASAALAGYMLVASTTLSSLFGAPDSEQVARDTSAAYTALPPEQRAHTAVVGDSYIIAAMVEVGRAEHELPEVFSPNRGYGYFGPPGEHVDSVLVVGDPKLFQEHFTDVQLVADGEVDVWLATGRIGDWAQIWPQVRTL